MGRGSDETTTVGRFMSWAKVPSTVKPETVSYSLSPKVLQQLSKRTVLPAGCRIKYGCQGTEGTAAAQP